MTRRLLAYPIAAIAIGWLILGCCPKPKPVIPGPPVVTVADPIECLTPPLPLPLTAPIGFPAPDGQSIYVSLSDWARLADYLLGMRNWIEAAQPCIGPVRATL